MSDEAGREIRRWLVRGAVQGVGFRMFAMREATRLGLNGTVRNMADGSVEAIAQGIPNQLEQFETLLRKGPDMADVRSVEQVDYEDDGDLHDRFMIVG